MVVGDCFSGTLIFYKEKSAMIIIGIALLIIAFVMVYPIVEDIGLYHALIFVAARILSRAGWVLIFH